MSVEGPDSTGTAEGVSLLVVEGLSQGGDSLLIVEGLSHMLEGTGSKVLSQSSSNIMPSSVSDSNLWLMMRSSQIGGGCLGSLP